jgi:Ser/Thr protein kinase RdoA (MazF antagonist)
MREVIAAEDLGGFTPQRCRVELAQYGRRHRCTLRYILDGTDAAGAPAQRVVYGKVANDGTGARTVPVIAALREALAAPDEEGVLIPPVIAYRPELQLLLLEAIPGRPQIARLLKARLAGQPEDLPGAPTLEGAMAACGRIAAAIHSSGIGLGRERTLESEVAWQEQHIAELGRVSPELGGQLLAWLRQTAEAGRRGAALPLGFAHGDFTYTQLIFDGARSGLVDFDTVCQAEPALDLGQFLAYQRLAIRRNQRPASPAGLADQLGAGFLDAYLAAMGERIADEGALRARAHIYELLMLSRLAIHSWQKLKVSRMEQAMKLIEERIPWLP